MSKNKPPLFSLNEDDAAIVISSLTLRIGQLLREAKAMEKELEQVREAAAELARAVDERDEFIGSGKVAIESRDAEIKQLRKENGVLAKRVGELLDEVRSGAPLDNSPF